MNPYHASMAEAPASEAQVTGGTACDWMNANHVNRLNMRRMLKYIVAHSDGALS